jgi:hypothetical protein
VGWLPVVGPDGELAIDEAVKTNAAVVPERTIAATIIMTQKIFVLLLRREKNPFCFDSILVHNRKNK